MFNKGVVTASKQAAEHRRRATTGTLIRGDKKTLCPCPRLAAAINYVLEPCGKTNASGCCHQLQIGSDGLTCAAIVDKFVPSEHIDTYNKAVNEESEDVLLRLSTRFGQYIFSKMIEDISNGSANKLKALPTVDFSQVDISVFSLGEASSAAVEQLTDTNRSVQGLCQRVQQVMAIAPTSSEKANGKGPAISEIEDTTNFVPNEVYEALQEQVKQMFTKEAVVTEMEMMEAQHKEVVCELETRIVAMKAKDEKYGFYKKYYEGREEETEEETEEEEQARYRQARIDEFGPGEGEEEEQEDEEPFDGSPMDDDVDYDALANEAEAAEILAAKTSRPYAADTWTHQ